MVLVISGVEKPKSLSRASLIGLVGTVRNSCSVPAEKPYVFFVLILLTSIACALQHFVFDHAGRLMIFDSCHFIESGRQLSQALIENLRTPALGDLLLLDGFAMPILAALAFCIEGMRTGLPTSTLVFVQILVHGTTTVLIYMCAERLRLGKWGCLTAAIVWALYPPAVECTGTFLSEPTCALLMVATLFCALRAAEDRVWWSWLVLGSLVELTALSRTALLPTSLLWLLVLLIRLRPKRKEVISGVLGVVIAAIPWLCMTAAFCGHIEILPNRVPTQNMALGCDTTVGGWETMPVPPLTWKYYWRSPLSTLASAWIERPVAMASLSFSKIGRMWTLIFNDFHDSVLFLSFEAQLFWHELLVSAAAIGSCFWLLQKNARLPKFGAVLCLTGILGHLAFLPFEGLPRYAFSAMPFVILLAVGSFSTAVRPYLLAAVTSAAAVVLFFLACDPHEVQVQLRPGDSVTRAIRIDRQHLSQEPQWAAIIIDGQMDSDDVEVLVDGRVVNSRQQLMNDAPSSFPHQATIRYIQRLLSRTKGVQDANVRQWRLIALPPQLVPQYGDHTVELIAVHDCTIYAQPKIAAHDYLPIPSLRFFSVTKFFASPSGLDGRVPDSQIIRGSDQLRTELKVAKNNGIAKAPVGEAPQYGQYRIFLLCSPTVPVNIDATAGHSDSAIRVL